MRLRRWWKATKHIKQRRLQHTKQRRARWFILCYEGMHMRAVEVPVTDSPIAVESRGSMASTHCPGTASNHDTREDVTSDVLDASRVVYLLSMVP